MEHHYFDCACSDFGHVVRFVLDNKDGDLWLEFNLSQYHTFWGRLRHAWRYLWGKESLQNGHYDCTILREEDFTQLHALLDRAQLLKRQHKASQEASEKHVLNG